jgi:hypothetical protein
MDNHRSLRIGVFRAIAFVAAMVAASATAIEVDSSS